MSVNGQEIRKTLRGLGLAGRAVCLHGSLRSHGHVEGGAEGLVRAFLDEGCTVLVPVFSSGFEIAPPAHLRFERNGWDYDSAPAREGSGRVYTPDSSEVDREMGAIPAAVLAMPGRVRGRHPLDSFAAVGPRAAELVSGQSASNVYAPLKALVSVDGFVLLLGVGLERLTLLHLAEGAAGRVLFRRWANDSKGRPSAVEVGGCSEGFGRLEPYLRPIMRKVKVGQSLWTLLPAGEAVSLAADAIRSDPSITHCGDAACERCRDAVAGGPILPAAT
ncbi:MAG TPA: AAC(3) family N-acetyltransferase [Pyrinomonadaceae bacterium]|nr:AAC(3) family N-acetyltransferase [Pyrinomonadaceae bacterium]